jgi:glycerol-3-phosphate acyltransferase PlsY
MKRKVYRGGALLAFSAGVAVLAIILTENSLHAEITTLAASWSEWGRWLAAAVGGYLLGSIPFGFIVVAILHERDIRDSGSGRTGGTNALRASGFGAATITVLCDLLKGAAGVALARLIFPVSSSAEVLAGLGVVLGHNASIYLGFRGGAGTAPSMGVAGAFWWPSLIFTVPFLPLGLWVIGIASLTSLVIGLVIIGVFVLRAASGVGPWEYVAYGVGALLLVAFALRPNIKRLLNGTEPIVGPRARRLEKRTVLKASQSVQPPARSGG